MSEEIERIKAEIRMLEERQRELWRKLHRERLKLKDKPRANLVELLKRWCPISDEKIKDKHPVFLQGKSHNITKAALEYINSIAESRPIEGGILGLAIKYGCAYASISKRIHDIARLFGFDDELRKVPGPVRVGPYIGRY